MLNFFDRVNNNAAYKKLSEDVRGNNFTAAFGVQPSEKPFIAADIDAFVLYVCSDYVESQRVLRTVNALTGGGAVFIPAKDDVLLFKQNASRNGVYLRNSALHALFKGAPCAVICAEALMQPLPDVEVFKKSCFTLRTGARHDTAALAARLVSAGYVRQDGISAEGEFTLRGDILDISVPLGKRYRIDFFDDEIESIRTVNADLSGGEKQDAVEIFPLFDTTGLSSVKISQIGKFASASKADSDAKARLSEIISSLELSAAGGRADNLWLAPFVKTSVLSHYLPYDCVVVWDEPKLISARVNFLYDEHYRRMEHLVKAGEILPVHLNTLIEKSTLFDGYAAYPQLSLQTLPYASDFFQPQVIHNFKTGAVSNYAMSEEMLAGDVKRWLANGYETVILAGTDGCAPVARQLSEYGVFAAQEEKLLPGAADALILPVAVEKGFISHSNKLAVIGTRDIGRGMSETVIRKSKRQAFLSVEKGDYVVHDIHGIGLCEGIRKITAPSGEVKDYIAVTYKNGDKLYVPVENSNLLSRYSGGENPALSRLGGEDFARVKSKVKSSIREMSLNLLKLYAEREKARGFSYHIDKYLDEEFDRYFPYKPTEDQLKCEEEIDADLMSDKIMDRVLVGDVGYGKTEVAMRAAFKVVSNGFQAAVLVPTTILAEQHYKTFSKRMEPFEIKVRCLNRFRNAGEQRAILKEAASGEADIIIGTHRLLSSDVRFAKLGLLVLDEEQRFGVEHKEKIKEVKTSVDVLTLSATPIPRTLHMALSGIRDISTITTPPVERMAVETFVAEESDAMIKDVIDRELSRGGQVFCVYNRVRSIDSFAARIAALVPDAHIVVAHGQMSENALEDAVYGFSAGKGNVLVCSTIIENGIDMPNANTLIVYDADKLGLSQLYQLRGRVGRSNKLAYAYFMYKRDKILSETAYKRLSSITEYSELGSGFKIAMKDLEIRGAGNILGREQHGHMVKVGYDMYARLLKESVAELKGEKIKPRINTEIEIDIEAYAPDTYIPSDSERMDFYRQLAEADSIDETDKLKTQISDIYGVMPVETLNLFRVAELKILAAKCGVVKVAVKPGRAELTFAEKENMMRKEVFDALSEAGDRVTLSSSGYSAVFASADFLQKDRLMAALKNFLSSAAR